MPLKLKLAAHERLVVNGAVMTNGGCRATLVIGNFAHILREKDVLQEDDADTPTKLAYFQVQAMLMRPPPAPELMESFRHTMIELRRAYIKPRNLEALDEVDQYVVAENYYRALMALQPLIEYEAALLNIPPHEWRRTSRRELAPGVERNRAETSET